MEFPFYLSPAVDAFSSSDLAELEVIGMRRNSFVLAFCSLLALASVSVYGLQAVLVVPILMLGVTSFCIGLFLNKKYLVASQRALVTVVFLTVITLSTFSKSISTTVIFLPLFTFIFFTERSATIRWSYMLLASVVLGFTFYRFYPNVGLDNISGPLLTVEAVTDCLLSTIFTGIFLRTHSVFSRITIEVAKSHAIRLDESLQKTNATINELEKRKNHLSEVQKQTATAISKERLAAGAIKASKEQLVQFAYAASHDLKEPIRTVRSFYQVIRRRIDPRVLAEAEIVDLFSLVEERSAAMHNMLERLLQYSRLSTRAGVKQRLNIVKLLSDRVAQMEPKPELSFSIAPSCEWGWIESNCLNQIFEELLTNAVQFASPDRPLALAFSAKRGRLGYVECMLQDNGIGIEEENLVKVIGLFQRLSSTDTQTGAGLGLSIASAIVAKNGGEFWITSNETGTTIHFELPAVEGLN